MTVLLRKFVLIVFVALFMAVPGTTGAASDLEVSGWVPYWSGVKATQNARKHMDTLSIVHPFGYTLRQNGTLHDAMGIKKSHWKKLFKTAKDNDVLVIPTITTSDGALVHRLLSDSTLREEHIEEIVTTVKKGKFDGIDIDYEGKWSETKEYFALFLEELDEALGSKLLTCAIEARTPPDSLYKVVPESINYANDYEAIAKHCDRVEIMTYDQQRADIKLNDERSGEPYIPVSDADWVEKVIKLALESIPKEKIMLGVPTYGHHYEVVVEPNWFRSYGRVGALNAPAAEKLAKKEKVKPSRNKGGEISFSYATIFSAPEVRSRTVDVPKNIPSGNLVAARALAYANETGLPTVFNYVTWSDAEAIEEKVKLAEKYDLRGIAIFKIDGQEDKEIWKLFE